MSTVSILRIDCELVLNHLKSGVFGHIYNTIKISLPKGESVNSWALNFGSTQCIIINILYQTPNFLSFSSGKWMWLIYEWDTLSLGTEEIVKKAVQIKYGFKSNLYSLETLVLNERSFISHLFNSIPKHRSCNLKSNSMVLFLSYQIRKVMIQTYLIYLFSFFLGCYGDSVTQD